ncbi:DNA polymerase III subunit chi [Hahella ganghwensis]|uniref:DNA polymerase III subunit chi n=1 Tax=Hahella ganghwensis TaxID=286420 RepID=UPI00036995BE|nr:DNA polymerase III subunit chi [Hahella ganghwensis]
MPNKADFYLLNTAASEAVDHFVCRLAEKAVRLGNQIYIACRDQEQIVFLDDLLYEFKTDCFLPHCRVNDPDTLAPIVLGEGLHPDQKPSVVVNLSSIAYTETSRVIEIVPNASAEKHIARNKFKEYKEVGFDMNTHSLEL